MKKILFAMISCLFFSCNDEFIPQEKTVEAKSKVLVKSDETKDGNLILKKEICQGFGKGAI